MRNRKITKDERRFEEIRNFWRIMAPLLFAAAMLAVGVIEKL